MSISIAERILLLNQNVQQYYRDYINIFNVINREPNLIFPDDIINTSHFYGLYYHNVVTIDNGDDIGILVEQIYYENPIFSIQDNIDYNNSYINYTNNMPHIKPVKYKLYALNYYSENPIKYPPRIYDRNIFTEKNIIDFANHFTYYRNVSRIYDKIITKNKMLYYIK